MPADGGGYTCIDLNKCVANVDGVLTLGGRGFADNSKDWHFPNLNLSAPWNNAMMVATCQKLNGEWVTSLLDLEDHLRINKGVLEVVLRGMGDAILGNLSKIFGGGAPVGPTFAPATTMMLNANDLYDKDGRYYNKECRGMYDYYEDKLGFHIWVGRCSQPFRSEKPMYSISSLQYLTRLRSSLAAQPRKRANVRFPEWFRPHARWLSETWAERETSEAPVGNQFKYFQI
ncbi:hypothetical protein BKA70DRAFT_1231250 [Coprinopsis sp. MPI-PUGE-AT-0042]|nr:hypothetical protein BKA70DRAFT_1231250 [Coprinopsis sp. MPI-PUGE-AT-0042]